MILTLLCLPLALADEGLRLDAAWRPTLRRAYVFYGASDDQIPLNALVAGSEVAGGEGLANSRTALDRFEARLRYDLGQDLGLYTQVMGGAFAMRFTEEGALHEGSDWNVDLGGSVGRSFSEDLRFDTIMAMRVRAWALGAPEVPVHGNVGIVLGVRPEFHHVSLYVEATLAAVWLTDLTAWGAQKDSSILRIRPEYTWTRGPLQLTAGLDYYHTHTEFFGTQLIPGEEAFMLDDFDLALVLGAGWTF